MPQNDGPRWTGSISVNFESDTPGLAFSFLTDADDIYIWPRVSSDSVDGPEKISVSLSATLFGDPFLQWLLAILSASAVLISILAQRWLPLK
jgi:hypothetical protein